MNMKPIEKIEGAQRSALNQIPRTKSCHTPGDYTKVETTNIKLPKKTLRCD